MNPIAAELRAVAAQTTTGANQIEQSHEAGTLTRTDYARGYQDALRNTAQVIHCRADEIEAARPVHQLLALMGLR